jgi:hypothetical protein
MTHSQGDQMRGRLTHAEATLLNAAGLELRFGSLRRHTERDVVETFGDHRLNRQIAGHSLDGQLGCPGVLITEPSAGMRP